MTATSMLSFADTGKGIEPEYVDHVFEPFFTTKREGIGLGAVFLQGDRRKAWRLDHDWP